MIRTVSSFPKQYILKLKQLIYAVLIGCVFCIGFCRVAEGAGVTMRETEPNNTMATARAISLKQSYAGNLQGSSDVDYYSFELTAPGTSQLSFSHAGVSTGVWDVEIRDVNGKQITGFWSEARDTTKKTNRLRLPVGDYYVRVSSSVFNKSDYSLSIDYKEETGTYEWEFNDTIETATGVNVNQLWTGNLQGYSDHDCYRFSLAASGNLQLDFSHAASQTGNWRVQLWDEDHIITFFLSEPKDTQKKSDYLNLPAGNYYLKVFHPDPEEVPVDPPPTTTTTTNTTAATTTGNTTTGTTETSETTAPSTETITYTFSDIDYSFSIGFVPPWTTDPLNAARDVPLGKTIEIDFINGSYKIFDSSKNPTLTRDDGTSINIDIETIFLQGYAECIDNIKIKLRANLDYNTTYTVKLPAGFLKDATGNVMGEYQFSFTTEASPATVIKGTEVIPGTPVNGLIKTGDDVQYYYFDTRVAGTYIIETLGNVDTVGHLYNANGMFMGWDDDSGSLRNFRIIRNLPANRIYGLDVYSWGKSTGAYTLNIMKLEAFNGNLWPEKTDLPTQKDFTVTFSRAVDLASLAGKVYVKNTRGEDQNVSVTIKPGSGDKKIIITHPGTGYQPGEIYWLYISDQLKDQASGVLIKEPVRMQFTIKDI